jgi:hypothetical protein
MVGLVLRDNRDGRAKGGSKVKDRQIFGVAVRLVGLYVGLYFGILDLFSGFGRLASPEAGHSSIPYFVMGALAALAGALLIKGEWLVRFAYGRES